MSEQESGNHGHPDASDELDHDVEAHKHHGRDKHVKAIDEGTTSDADFEAHRHQGRDAAAAAEKPSDDFEAHKHHGKDS